MDGKKKVLVIFASIAALSGGGWFAFDSMQKQAAADARHQVLTNVKLCADALNASVKKIEFATVYSNFKQTTNLMRQYQIDRAGAGMESVIESLRKNFDVNEANAEEMQYARLIAEEALGTEPDQQDSAFMAKLIFAQAHATSKIWNADFAEADRYARRAIDIGDKTKHFGDHYLDAAKILARIADVRYDSSMTRLMDKELREDVLQAEEAARLALHAYDNANMSKSNPIYCDTLDRLATCEQMLGKFDEAQKHLETAMQFDRSGDPQKTNQRLINYKVDLANVYVKQQSWAKASPLLRQVIAEYHRNPKLINNPMQIYNFAIDTEEHLNNREEVLKLRAVNHRLKAEKRQQILGPYITNP